MLYLNKIRSYSIRTLIIGISLIIVYGFQSMAYAQDGKKDLTKIVFAFTDPGFSPATAYVTSVPQLLGFFEDEGIEVVFQPVNGASAGAQAVETGQAFISLAGAGGFYPYISKSDDLRVVGFYSDSIYKIEVDDDSPIKTIEDLKDKTIGVQTMASGSYQFDRVLVDRAGLDPDKDVKWLPVGVGSQAAAAYEKGDVDALGLWDSANAIAFNMAGMSSRAIDSELTGIPAMSTLLVRKSDIEENPDLIIGFLRAIWRGAVWSKANPEEAIELQWKMFPEQAPIADDKEEKKKFDRVLLENRLQLVVPHENLYGYAKPEDVQATADILLEAGTLSEKFDTSKYVDLSLIEESNNFSVEETKTKTMQ